MFIKNEKLKLGFVYDTSNHRIVIIDLKTMESYQKLPYIETGQITHMFLDKEANILYFQQGNYHDKLEIVMQALDLQTFEYLSPIVIDNYKMHHHKTTLL